MKSKVLWLYGVLGIGSVILIVLGLNYMGNKADTSDSAGNPIPEGIHKLFNQIDTDTNGAISLREFAEQVNRRVQGEQVQTQQARVKILQAQFEAGDKDKDSFINKDEYAELVLIKQLGEKAPDFSTFDENKDDKLGFREYVAFREKVASPRPE